MMSCNICYHGYESRNRPGQIMCVLNGDYRDRNFICNDFSRVNAKELREMQSKIDELEAENKKLKKDIEEFVDLGTDQFVAEKIVKLEAKLKEAVEVIEFYGSKDNWELCHGTAYAFAHIAEKDWDSKYLGNDGNKDLFSKPVGGKKARQFLRGMNESRRSE